MKVLFSPPDIGEDEIKEVTDALRSGWITTGPKTKQFEKNIAAYCHTTKAVCLNSATAGLELTLRIMGIGEGDEVITTAYTYTATASCICHAGATPVLVDTLPGSIEMDPDKVRDAITDKTKAIICVDLAGVVYSHYDEIFDIVEEKKSLFKPTCERQAKLGRIMVMADAAHAFGASHKGLMAGQIADFSVYSFHAVKNLTTAEGGAVTWSENVLKAGIDEEEMYHEYMLMSLHGQSKDALAKTQIGAWEYDVIAPLYKCNMTDVVAAIGLSQLRRYDAMLKRRKEMIERYNEALKDKNVEYLNHYGDDHNSSGHLYILRLLGKTREEVNDIIIKLGEKDIATNVHYKPLPMHTAYKNMGFDIKDFPNAYKQFENEITLPLHTCLTDEQLEYVISELCKLI